MKPAHLPLCLVATCLIASPGLAAETADPPGPALFESFEYTGDDPVFEKPLPPGSFRNPILAGFYSDPSICQVGPDYYLVTSTFSWFPGVPIFHSRDLVHWKQIGHVLSRPSQLNLDGLGVSRGIFAPAISHHKGVFYMITTLVDAGGNFYVTATDPAGPWSDPVWLREIDGIDPSIFFDNDGRAYIVNNGPPPDNKPLYGGHRAVWVQEFDVASGQPTGPREIIVNGGVDISKKPVWIEGPHIFRKDDWYYLTCAEGGTSVNHSQVIFRSKSPRGPYVPWDKNPILTQRNLDPNRPTPVTSTGHADLVTTADGSWWGVFLGCRPYEGDYYNTGRETFLLPVTWKDGWPIFLEPGQPVPDVVPAPQLPPSTAPAVPTTGNFTWRDEFDAPKLDPSWMFLRTRREDWFSLKEKTGALALTPRPASLLEKGNPSLVARRQQHVRFTAAVAVQVPDAAGTSAGLVAFQNEAHHFFLGLRRRGTETEVFLERAKGSDQGGVPQEIAHASIRVADSGILHLKIEGNGRPYSFHYATRPGAWIPLKENEDGTIVSTHVAGGFVGTCLGIYARLDR